MKTFYTERDIEDLHTAGVTEIEVNDDVVLTDLAREKATALGMQLKLGTEPKGQAERILKNLGAHPPSPTATAAKTVPTAPPAPSSPKTDSGPANTELIQRVKAGVIAKLGTTEYNDLLDQIIPQVLTRLNSQSKPGKATGTSSRPQKDY